MSDIHILELRINAVTELGPNGRVYLRSKSRCLVFTAHRWRFVIQRTQTTYATRADSIKIRDGKYCLWLFGKKIL